MNHFIILGKGYIGSHLHYRLIKQNKKCLIFSKLDLNYTDPHVLGSFIRQYKSDICPNDKIIIINASGYTGSPNVDDCENNKQATYTYNVTVPLIIDNVVYANSDKCICMHIGSGCIYNGYEKEFTEFDPCNFGLFNSNSSFYSKTKHLFELIASLQEQIPSIILRIRMPLSEYVLDIENLSKNYFMKLSKYKHILNAVNSKTSLDLLTKTILSLSKFDILPYKILNVVHPKPLDTKSVIDILKESNFDVNEDQMFHSEAEFYALNEVKVRRSNCILNTDRLSKLLEGDIETEESFLRRVLFS